TLSRSVLFIVLVLLPHAAHDVAMAFVLLVLLEIPVRRRGLRRYLLLLLRYMREADFRSRFQRVEDGRRRKLGMKIEQRSKLGGHVAHLLGRQVLHDPVEKRLITRLEVFALPHEILP